MNKGITSCSRIARRYYSTGVELDRKWLQRWSQAPARHSRDVSNGPKYYALAMFPYPSGALHIGHLRVYTISDVLARYRRMNGYNVVHAMGWDAFGLPAENAAIERGIDPKRWTVDNIQSMKQQMGEMFADFDWEREVVSCSPEYYKWTQKLFIMMHEHGLAYRKKARVNWDPVEQTVLANEQVDENGKSWRSGAIVEQKMLSQWFLGITKYASELLKDLELLEDWPANVKAMQANWIGQSHGANLTFQTPDGASLSTFTTRPDTLFGVQYVAVAVDHPLVISYAAQNAKLQKFVSDSKFLPEDTKEGYQLPLFVSSPLTPGVYDVPVFVAPYVISDYGSGCVMGCPGHDQRDSEFWKQNSGTSALRVIDPPENAAVEEIYTGKDGTLNASCGEFAGMSSKDGGKAIVDKVAVLGLGEHTTKLKLRDWLVSRQRFWGAPIPMVHCDDCGIVPVPDNQLPVRLPENLSAPLASNEEFLSTPCPSCQKPAKRDSDTMDTFMDSSWYFFRYTDAQNKDKIFDYNAASNLMPVDIYVGGVEHAILHLLYSRFISKFLRDYGAWDGGNLDGEPIKRLVTQGMVHGKTFTDPNTGKFLKPHEVDLTNPESPKVKETQQVANVSFEKMSKSKYNGADPGQCIVKHGADATRAHILFQAPVAEVLNWDESKIVGIERWLLRVQQVVHYAAQLQDYSPVQYDKLGDKDEKFWTEVQAKIKTITQALHETLGLNTLISDYMKLARTIQSAQNDNISPNVVYHATSALIKLIAPVVPATAEECWEVFHQQSNPSGVFAESWPQFEAKPETNLVKYGVLINGKRRVEVTVDRDTPADTVLEQARVDAAPWIGDKTVNRIVVPPGKKIISFILERK